MRDDYYLSFPTLLHQHSAGCPAEHQSTERCCFGLHYPQQTSLGCPRCLHTVDPLAAGGCLSSWAKKEKILII